MLKAVETIKREIDVFNMNELRPGCAYYITRKLEDGSTVGFIGLCLRVTESKFFVEWVDVDNNKIETLSIPITAIMSGECCIVSRFSVEEESLKQKQIQDLSRYYKKNIMDPIFKMVTGVDPNKEE